MLIAKVNWSYLIYPWQYRFRYVSEWDVFILRNLVLENRETILLIPSARIRCHGWTKIMACISNHAHPLFMWDVITHISMGLLPDTYNCGLRMRRECQERFPRHRLKRKPLVRNPSMHHGTCVTHVPWCMSGSLTRGGGENSPGIPGACATRNFAYLARGPRLNFS